MSKTKLTAICITAVIAVLVLAACRNDDPSEIIPAVTPTHFQRPPENMRNYRYCEILPIFQRGATLYIEVYASFGLNECPDDAWQALSADEIAEEYGAVQVKMNGPRFWLVNQTASSNTPTEAKVAKFGNLELRRAAVLERPLLEVGGSAIETFYVDNEVQRSTTYLFSAGNMVYELISPDGDVYRMQSYAHIVDATLTIDDLETLDERLDLPDGWRYQARVLDEDSVLIADGLAFVLSDNLQNSYQKITESGEN